MHINCETNKYIDAERELKPCPFCGCDMKIESVTIDYIETALLVGSPRHKDGCMLGAMPSPRSKDIDKLVCFWNRRADDMSDSPDLLTEAPIPDYITEDYDGTEW